MSKVLSPISRLQQVLAKGDFAVTGECGPPRGADPDVVNIKVEHLKGFVDAVNVTDNQTAIVRMSSIAASTHLLHKGLEPVMQMVTRDATVLPCSRILWVPILWASEISSVCPGTTRLLAVSPTP